MAAQLFHADPQTLYETLHNLEMEFDRQHGCFGDHCFKSYCDHPRQPENRQRDLQYEWEQFLYSHA